MKSVGVSVSVSVGGSAIRFADAYADRLSNLANTHQDTTIDNDTFPAAQEEQTKIAYAYAYAYAYETEGHS